MNDTFIKVITADWEYNIYFEPELGQPFLDRITESTIIPEMKLWQKNYINRWDSSVLTFDSSQMICLLPIATNSGGFVLITQWHPTNESEGYFTLPILPQTKGKQDISKLKLNYKIKRLSDGKVKLRIEPYLNFRAYITSDYKNPYVYVLQGFALEYELSKKY